MELDERFWSSSLEELKDGYSYDAAKECYGCLICGETFLKGEIFRLPESDRYFEASKYAAYHVMERHGSMLNYLLSLDKKATGLTDLQKEFISQFAEGLSDNEIVKRSGSGSASTVRNHRFVLKEKAKQAKLLLAIMELMEQGGAESERFVTIHRTATQVDERYAITEAEYKSWIQRYLPHGPEGPLQEFPSKEKRKIAILRHIASYFKHGVSYEEKDVNERLQRFWAKDYVTLRRYLIQYGFLDRKDDGSAYWLKHPTNQRESAIEEEGGLKMDREEKQKASRPDKETRKQLTAEYQERERVMGVYQIKNNANGRVFIGGSTNMDGLWNKEKFVLELGSHMNKELQREWKQYGSEQFSYLVLETVKTEGDIRYNYNDVYDENGNELAEVAKGYKREVERLKEQWLKKLNPYGESGYH